MYKGKKLLIVDDSPVELHLLKNICSKLGFTIIEAVDGETGVAKAQEHKPDIVLMDVVMPGMNGFQATRKIVSTEGLQDVPVIMCTSKGQPTDKIWGQRQGAKAYVVKPVNEEELVSEIKRLMD